MEGLPSSILELQILTLLNELYFYQVLAYRTYSILLLLTDGSNNIRSEYEFSSAGPSEFNIYWFTCTVKFYRHGGFNSFYYYIRTGDDCISTSSIGSSYTELFQGVSNKFHFK
jgi:hypothetical protein